MQTNITLYTEKELSRELNISLPKLRRDRLDGKGFPYVKIGKSVRYPMVDILEHLKKINQLKHDIATEHPELIGEKTA